MKKSLLVGLAIGVVSMSAAVAFAGPSQVGNLPAQGYAGAKNVGGNGIVGSSHDLSITGGSSAFVGPAKDAQSRICIFCHHPHNAMPPAEAGGYSPLWNREMSTVTFAAYNNGGFNNVSNTPHSLQSAGSILGGVSLLCMSCHDGVVAMNAYSQTTGISDGAPTAAQVAAGGKIVSSAGFDGDSGRGYLKSDMSNHHPMGFDYNAVQAKDNEIAASSVAMVPTGITQAGGGMAATTGVTIAQLLDSSQGFSKMECVTCHDVHNTQNAPGAERFLWRSNNKSNFCLTCHLK